MRGPRQTGGSGRVVVHKGTTRAGQMVESRPLEVRSLVVSRTPGRETKTSVESREKEYQERCTPVPRYPTPTGTGSRRPLVVPRLRPAPRRPGGDPGR